MAPMNPTPAIEVRGLTKSYGDHEAVRGIDFTRRPRRGVRSARAQRGGKDHDRRDPRGIPRAHRRSRLGPRVRPWPPRARTARARGHRPAVVRHVPPRHRPRGDRALGVAVPTATRRRRGRRAGGPGSQAARLRAPAIGRPASAAGLRAGDGRRPRADLPRRADDGLRSRRAPRGLEHDPLAARPGQDRAADHPLPRRGADARRPGGDHQGRADPGGRDAGASWARAPRRVSG